LLAGFDAIVFLVPPFLLLLRYDSLELSLSAILLVFAGVYRLARYSVEEKVSGKVKGLIASQPAHYIYLSILLGASINFLIILCLIASIFRIIF
jgi:phosphatidylserine synthase